jgi:restriction system protein
VTARSGDQGIDGYGTVRINPLVSFQVLFQCKRYRDSASAPHVRDFCGAMAGRADKGIIITRGSQPMKWTLPSSESSKDELSN